MTDLQPMPALTADQLAALREDIAENGIRVPVVVDQHDRVLDGHNRRAIADELGIECPTITQIVADDDEAWSVAVTLNCARRHLTSEQKRTIISEELRRRPDDSDRAIARRVGCDHKTVGVVRRAGEGGEIPHAAPTMSRAEAEERTKQTREALDKFFYSLVDAAIAMRRDGLSISQTVAEVERFRRELYRDCRTKFPLNDDVSSAWEEVTDQRFDAVVEMLLEAEIEAVGS